MGIATGHLEAEFNVVVRVRADNEVNVVPVGEETALDVGNSFRQMLSVEFP